MSVDIDKDDTAALQIHRNPRNPDLPVIFHISNVQDGFLLEPLAHVAVTRERAEAIIRDIKAILDGD